MKPFMSLVLFLGMVVCPSIATAESDADGFTGYWYTEKQSSIIHITKAEKGYNGKIVWLKEPNYAEGKENAGKPKVDSENPDKDKRSQTIVGLSIMSKFEYNEDTKKWTGGLIYDPESGKNYKCEAKVEPNPEDTTQERLNVRGYIGIPRFGRSTLWTPAPEADLIKLKLIEPKAAE